MKELEFGTAGLRGILGKTKEHLNIFHVARVIEGFAKYLKSETFNWKNKIVIIGRDNRRKSREFSRLAASILAFHKINVLISREIIATPIISYATKYHKALGAINITASHNPKEYNGIKLYDKNGSQILPDVVDKIKSNFLNYEDYTKKQALNQFIFSIKNKYINYIPKQTLQSYEEKVLKVGGSQKNLSNINLSFSPQHGTGAKIVKSIFKKLNVNAFFEEAQMKNDPDFTHTKSPNPEDKSSYENVIKLGLIHKSDAVLITDPDADRVGIGILRNNEYILLNGNETATLIFNYLIEINENKLQDKYLIYSFVSSSLPKKMAIENNIKWYEVATGFKYIGNLIEQIKNESKTSKLLFAFEESYGSLINDSLAYDKDAIQSCVILAKMISFYKKKSKTLLDVLEDIYKKYGYIKSESFSINLDEKNPLHLENIQSKFINLKFNEDFKIENFIKGKENIAPSNMIRISFQNLNWIALRPSGTEAKIKFYLYVVDKDKILVEKNWNILKEKILSII
ncbi:phospho-sugar mutase [[Mycoplasma] mobile]|uniref:Phosphomannomutase n=1 Tax=Mycoplasma mobile (strain ATCC 43663 / 163K / NCTC 11711) TaxID=267748 RepID=Q6KI27_MYCM1|nr:phospho-sugar mutase [[Mycoplasma] mobile]AAT27749.1 phosphomannomutase [Mycoplasma mobile 163K]